ncbi:hypothetical protein ACROYT_G015157 [Oculina patagonica]
MEILWPSFRFPPNLSHSPISMLITYQNERSRLNPPPPPPNTNLVVMVDDPIISSNMGEMLLQVQSRLTMGSRTGGVAEGRVLVFQYSKSNFSVQDKKRLEEGVKTIATEHTMHRRNGNVAVIPFPPSLSHSPIGMLITYQNKHSRLNPPPPPPKTNLVVMVDDPIISSNMGEMLLQVQSRLTMGSRTGGVSTSPGGSILLTSNSNVVSRVEGRVLVFQYLLSNFSVQDKKRLEEGVKSIATKHMLTFRDTDVFDLMQELTAYLESHLGQLDVTVLNWSAEDDNNLSMSSESRNHGGKEHLDSTNADFEIFGDHSKASVTDKALKVSSRKVHQMKVRLTVRNLSVQEQHSKEL